MALAIKPHNPAFTTYYQTLKDLHAKGIYGELQTRHAFANLLQTFAKETSWLFVPEYSLPNRKRPDATFLGTEFDLTYGYWESKGPNEDLDLAIRDKLTFYPLTNIIFENTKIALLFQDGKPVRKTDLQDRQKLADLLTEFFSYAPPENEDFLRTWQTLAQEPKDFTDPDVDSANVLFRITRKILESIGDDYECNNDFRQAFDTFHAICRETLDPTIKKTEVESLLAQHLLTERIAASIFPKRDFRHENVIARELDKVVAALQTYADIQRSYLKDLAELYEKIEEVVKKLYDFEAKHRFLSRIYEGFFKQIAPNQADTHGIVYTPQPIVGFMCTSVEQLLQKEFGLSLAAEDVVILDPCVGTGTFIMQLLRMLPHECLPAKYAREIFCNEVMLLPYYLSSLSIEEVYREEMDDYQPFTGICFADTLDLVKKQQTFFNEEVTKRVEREREAKITVIIGNPPYNMGQKSENDNNKNRRYRNKSDQNGVDDRIQDTYAKDSRASLKNKLYDAYVRFFRWATDRLEDRDGIVCFVSNNGFLRGIAFDGFRQHLAQDFTKIYHLDFMGNARTSGEQRRREGGNIFSDQIRTGIGITILVRNRQKNQGQKQTEIWYHRVGDYWTAAEKQRHLTSFKDLSEITWQELQPNLKHTWLTEGLLETFETFLPMGTKEAKAAKALDTAAIFKTYSLGVVTSRDSVVYDFSYQNLAKKMEQFITDYNAEVLRWIAAGMPEDIANFISYEKIKWTDRLKEALTKQQQLDFGVQKIRHSLYRPFCRQYLYFDHLLNQRRYQQHYIFPTPASEEENVVICISGVGSNKPFHCFVTNCIPDLHFVGDTQCFPFYTYDADGSSRQENITAWAVKQFEEKYGPLENALDLKAPDRKGLPLTAKAAIFYYTYALLHHPVYRERYAKNLKLALPRIPLVGQRATFGELVKVGVALADLHLKYEQQEVYPLQRVVKGMMLTERVEALKLIEEKTALVVNPSLTLKGIPPECFEYKLGNRSALEWVVEQYRVKRAKDGTVLSDPNRAGDEGYIVRLVGQVITVSIQTVALVKRLAQVGL